MLKGVIFMQKKFSTKAVVHCAMLIAIALVLRNLSYTVPMGGSGGMRMGVSGFFYKLPSLVFGPMYGGIACGLYDLLAYVIKPEGAYIFPMTLVMIAGGVICGFLFKAVRGHRAKTIRNIYISFIALMGAFGAFNHLSIICRPDGKWGAFLISLGRKMGFFTYGFYLACLIGVLFYGINLFFQKKNKGTFADTYMKIFLAVFVSDIFVTTANTFVLMTFVPSLGRLGFLTFYLPRLAQEIASVFLTSYFLTYFYVLYKRLDK